MPSTKRRFINVPVKPPATMAHYNFSAGVNTLTSNENLPPEATPYARNHRYNSRESIKTRKGPGFYSQPIGEVLETTQTGATSTNEQITTTVRKATSITPTHAKRLTTLQLYVKNSGNGSGPLMVELWTDSGGAPGTRMAQSSIESGLLTSSYQWLPAYFLAAPDVTASTTYWVVAYIQSDGTGAYLWSSATGSSNQVSTSNGPWSSTTGSLNLKSYLSPANPTLGKCWFKQSTGGDFKIIANASGAYTINEITGANTQIFAGTTTATHYEFAQVNDTLYFVNGVDVPQSWNGVTAATVAAPGSPPIADDILLHRDRLYYLSSADHARAVFTEPGDFSTILSVNFLYIPSPKSPDPVSKMTTLHNNLVFRTRGSKWIWSGYDLAQFTLRQSTGLRGAAGVNSVVQHDNLEYSVADNNIYIFNGSTDAPIGTPVQPDFDSITDKADTHMVAAGNYLRIFYPSVGATNNDLGFIYDLQFKIMFIDNQAYFNGGFSIAADQLVLVSSRVGQAYLADQNYNDLGAPIPFQYWTKYEAYGTPEQLKIMRRFFPKFIGQDGQYGCTISVDYNRLNSPTVIDETQMGLTGDRLGVNFYLDVSHLGGSGNPEPELEVEGEFRERQFRFEHTGVDQPVELYGHTDYFFRQRSL
jgi:hypothetical protein